MRRWNLRLAVLTIGGRGSMSFAFKTTANGSEYPEKVLP
jgi:hypothetical protein